MSFYMDGLKFIIYLVQIICLCLSNTELNPDLVQFMAQTRAQRIAGSNSGPVKTLVCERKERFFLDFSGHTK